MLGKAVFCLLPVILSASRCDEGGCLLNGNSRIMGGDITERNSRPFQVALYMRVGTTGELGFCGGSLVHQEWVLTAAHCCFHGDQQVDNVQVTIPCSWPRILEARFPGKSGLYLLGDEKLGCRELENLLNLRSCNHAMSDSEQAILGAHSLYDRYENGRRVVNVDEIVLHPDWQPDTFANDLALLRLANIMQITEMIDVVRLPYLSIASFNFAGQGATVSGWGIAAPGVTFVAPTLREKLMTVMTDPLCNTTYFNQLPENIVCGFSVAAGTCKGDNGGPMTIWFNATEETILIGVATFVDASGCNDDVPSVFTRVQRYLAWISEVTGVQLQ